MLNWQITRLFAFEDAIYVTCGALEQYTEVRAMNDQSADLSIFAKRVDARKLTFGKSCCDCRPLGKEKGVSSYQNAIRMVLDEPLQNALDFTCVSNVVAIKS